MEDLSRAIHVVQEQDLDLDDESHYVLRYHVGLAA